MTTTAAIYRVIRDLTLVTVLVAVLLALLDQIEAMTSL
jgi:hypothetical protein